MSAHTRSIVVAALGLGLAFTLPDCAKRPSVAAVAAPAPPARPAPPQDAPPPTMVQAPPAPAPVAPAAPPAPEVRPAPAEFMPNDALRPIHFDSTRRTSRRSSKPVRGGSCSIPAISC